MSLLRENVVSLYEQIASRLQAEILRGDYEPAGKLPSEAQLCERYGVSRVTVRQALDRLVVQGMVERKQGKGTYACGKQLRHGLNTLRSFHESLQLQGLNPQMQLLSRELQPLADKLHGLFGPGVTDSLQLSRLHLVAGEPVALGISNLPAALAALSWDEMAQKPTYALLESFTGQAVTRADMAIRAQAADKQVAPLLKVKPGSALLLMVRTSFFADGRCCDHSTFYIRPERYEFVLSSGYGANEA